MPVKKLPPSMMIRERYIVFEILSDKTFGLEDAVKAIWSSLLQLFGEAGVSAFHVWIPSNLYNKKRNTGIVRCSHNYVQQVRSALALIRKIDENPVIVKTLGVTGTIKSAKAKFLKISEKH